MTVQFEYQSDHLGLGDYCAILDIEIDVWCHDIDGDYGWENIVLVDRESNREIDFDSLPANEQSAIEQMADTISADEAVNAYQAHSEDAGDALYDRMRDGE
jgi:hypothetical protein